MSPAATIAQPHPDAAWQDLINGNARFVAGQALHPGQDAARRAELRDGQRPHTLVFGCSDSRVAAEIIFDQGLGDLFVVRTAGHVVDTGVLGSVEFAVSVLQVPLVVVLGHDQCGAVAAAVQAVRTGTAPPGYIRDMTERITPAVLMAQLAQRPHHTASITAPIDDIEAEHVRGTARLLVEKSRILDQATSTGRCLVASLFERAGRIRGRAGSVTQLMVLSMPDDDITHPVPDLTGYITEGQVVLSRELDRRGITPPIDVLPSLSRLMNGGIGAGRTREDHRAVADQVYACYARGRELRGLTTIVGEAALSESDRRYLQFADSFETTFLDQRGTRRTITQTLDLAWQLLGGFPRAELKRIPDRIADTYLPTPTS